MAKKATNEEESEGETPKKTTTAKKTTAPKKESPAKKKPDPKPAIPAAEAPEPKPPKRVVYKKIKVNFWRTKIHAEELGVHQQLKYEAKTRYFSKNFDIEGVVEFDGEKKYIIAFNKDDWNEKPLEEKTLTCRLFTIMDESLDAQPKGGNFKGGFELSITHSIIQSYEIRHAASVFFIQVPDTINLVKVVQGWRLVGTRWSFPLLPEEKDDKLQMVTAKGIVGPGRNYWLYIGDQKIARVDGQVVKKNFEIEIFNEDYAKDKTFVMYVTLFACACNFMDMVNKIIKRIYKKMGKTGTSDYKPTKKELDLFKNPRLIRR